MTIRIAPTIMAGFFYAIRAGFDTENGRRRYWVENHEGERRTISGQKFYVLQKRQISEETR